MVWLALSLCEKILLEVVEGVDEPGQVPLALQLLLQPGPCQPVSSVGVILPCLATHINHCLHPPRHVLLHLEGHRQRLPHPGPRVRLLNRLNWGCAKEVIVRGSPVKLILV